MSTRTDQQSWIYFGSYFLIRRKSFDSGKLHANWRQVIWNLSHCICGIAAIVSVTPPTFRFPLSLLDQTFTDFHKGLGRIFRIIFGKSVAHTRCWRWSFPILSWRWLNLGFLYHTKRPKTAFWSRIRIINTARFPLKCSSFVQMKESSIIRCKSPKIRSDEKTHHKQNTAKLGQASVAGQDLDVSTTSGSWMKLKAINVPMPATNIPNPRSWLMTMMHDFTGFNKSSHI